MQRATHLTQSELKTEDLLSRAVTPDGETIVALYDRVAPDLRGMLRRILDSPEDAEDVMETVLLTPSKTTGVKQASSGSMEARVFLAARREAVRQSSFRRSEVPAAVDAYR
ncbi:MAG: hypothetical protein ACRD06_09420 [Terriglobia bacterium]